MHRRRGSCPVASALAALIALARVACAAEATLAPTSVGYRAELPLPSSMSVADYERRLFEFLNARQYKTLGWLCDKGVRDTGAYVDGKYYGTHPAVRIFYSPEIIEWLRDEKRK